MMRNLYLWSQQLDNATNQANEDRAAKLTRAEFVAEIIEDWSTNGGNYPGNGKYGFNIENLFNQYIQEADFKRIPKLLDVLCHRILRLMSAAWYINRDCGIPAEEMFEYLDTFCQDRKSFFLPEIENNNRYHQLPYKLQSEDMDYARGFVLMMVRDTHPAEIRARKLALLGENEAA